MIQLYLRQHTDKNFSTQLIINFFYVFFFSHADKFDGVTTCVRHDSYLRKKMKWTFHFAEVKNLRHTQSRNWGVMFVYFSSAYKMFSPRFYSSRCPLGKLVFCDIPETYHRGVVFGNFLLRNRSFWEKFLPITASVFM